MHRCSTGIIKNRTFPFWKFYFLRGSIGTPPGYTTLSPQPICRGQSPYRSSSANHLSVFLLEVCVRLLIHLDPARRQATEDDVFLMKKLRLLGKKHRRVCFLAMGSRAASRKRCSFSHLARQLFVKNMFARRILPPSTSCEELHAVSRRRKSTLSFVKNLRRELWIFRGISKYFPNLVLKCVVCAPSLSLLLRPLH